ncbi:DNA replication protein [Tulasnella sp. 419]|nr:DNA replication protein [Tulasnella sp. 419]
MDNDYYSIEAIIAENQKLQCTFKLDVPDLGYLEGGNEKDIKVNSKLLLPYWLAPTLFLQEWVEIGIPQPYGPRVRKALDADALNVKLAPLVGGTGTWYGFGKMVVDILSEPQSTDLSAVLVKTFKERLVGLMDQAQHFGGTTGSLGGASGGQGRGGGDVADGGGEFREGLEGTERELFALAQESARRTKQWYENSDKRRK